MRYLCRRQGQPTWCCEWGELKVRVQVRARARARLIAAPALGRVRTCYPRAWSKCRYVSFLLSPLACRSVKCLDKKGEGLSLGASLGVRIRSLLNH